MDCPTGITKENLPKIINSISNGDWMNDLSEEQHIMLENWIRDMGIGLPNRPYLAITISVGSDEIMALAIHTCRMIENGKLQIECPGIVDWIHPNKKIVKEIAHIPICDLDTLTFLSMIED